MSDMNLIISQYDENPVAIPIKVILDPRISLELKGFICVFIAALQDRIPEVKFESSLNPQQLSRVFPTLDKNKLNLFLEELKKFNYIDSNNQTNFWRIDT